MKGWLSWRQIIPTVVTLAAMLCGFLSILATVWGMYMDRVDLYRRAAQLIILAMLLDGMDGNLARFLKGSSAFGAELDTYVDLTAFGIAPAILIFAVTFQGSDAPNWRMLLLPSMVALSGVVRLARFKVSDPLRGQAGYAGLPITANAAWVALLVFISQSEPLSRFSLHQGPVAILFLFGVLVFISLQVSNVRYPKPSKKAAIFIPVLVLAVFFFLPARDISLATAWVMIALGVSYIILGPWYMRQTLRASANGAPDSAQDTN